MICHEREKNLQHLLLCHAQFEQIVEKKIQDEENIRQQRQFAIELINIIGKFLHAINRKLKRKLDKKPFRAIFSEEKYKLPFVDIGFRDLSQESLKKYFTEGDGNINMKKAREFFNSTEKKGCLETSDRILMSTNSKIWKLWTKKRKLLNKKPDFNRAHSATHLKREREKRKLKSAQEAIEKSTARKTHGKNSKTRDEKKQKKERRKKRTPGIHTLSPKSPKSPRVCSPKSADETFKEFRRIQIQESHDIKSIIPIEMLAILHKIIFE